MDYAGRTAVVTGAATGIGRATARRLAAEGANVVVADVRRDPKPSDHFESAEAPTDERIRDAGGEATFVEADVSDPAAAEAMIETAVDTYGGLDVLVNNAGIDLDGTSQSITVEEWQRVLAVNLSGAFYCTKHAVPHLADAAGDLVFVSSVMGLDGGGGPPYASSKAGLINLARDLAVELGPDGVTVNAVLPGYVKTSIQNRKDEANLERAHERTLLPHLGDPSEVAAAIAFLASDEASFVHGAALTVDGGWTAHRG